MLQAVMEQYKFHCLKLWSVREIYSFAACADCFVRVQAFFKYNVYFGQ